MLISGICGSLRNESWNKLLLKIFLEKISDNSNFETDVIDVSKFPLYNADIEAKSLPESVLSAKEKVKNSDLIIFASILEREAATPQELSKIAGVFINRLKKGMRLQSDPTVIYGMTLGKSSLGRLLTRQDLKVDSPYNTYTRAGLPAGAICCPGLAALEAAVHPEETNELFFVLDTDEKQHRFSITYKEHLEHIRRIRKTLRVNHE